MKNVIQALAAICCLAIGSVASGQVVENGADPNRVAERVVYDIGIYAGEVDRPVETAPEGKADKIVVVTADWCAPCGLLKPVLARLKSEDYKVEAYEIDELVERYTNLKQVKNPEALNEWSQVPTIFYIRDGMVIKRDVGFKTARHIKETLWKPE